MPRLECPCAPARRSRARACRGGSTSPAAGSPPPAAAAGSRAAAACTCRPMHSACWPLCLIASSLTHVFIFMHPQDAWMGHCNLRLLVPYSCHEDKDAGMQECYFSNVWPLLPDGKSRAATYELGQLPSMPHDASPHHEKDERMQHVCMKYRHWHRPCKCRAHACKCSGNVVACYKSTQLNKSEI